jgi:hypothetical protein
MGQPPADQASAVEQWLLAAIDRHEPILPAHETQVRNTLDKLRCAPSDPAIVRRFETLSCTLPSSACTAVRAADNAYACALRRLERTARAA